MAKSLVLLSGPIAVGKSAVATALINHHGFISIRSGPYLRELSSKLGRGHSRTELQALGDELDKRTDYAWLISDVAIAALEEMPSHDRWLLDSVRKERQVAHFRRRYGAAVLHVHLTAAEDILRARYEARSAAGKEYTGNTPYSVAATHPNELAARNLIELADLSIDLHRTTPNRAAITIAENCKGRAQRCELS